MDYSSERNYGCRILEFNHRGLNCLSMENELLKIVITADRGADIVELTYKPRDVDFMWKAPGGIRPVGKFIPSSASSFGNYVDYLQGGWQEILPGGGPFNYQGAEIGLHGEVCLIPWSYHIENDDPDYISVELSCRTTRFPFMLVKRISLKRGSAIIEIEEMLTNNSDEELEFMWAQHPTFGKPFLDGKCKIDIPAEEFITSDFYHSPTALFMPEHSGSWPIDTAIDGKVIDLSIIPPRNEPTSDLYYIKGLQEGWYAITNIEKEIGIGFAWDLNIFPYLTYWQVCNGSPGYPWFNRTYNIGLELWNCFTDKFRTAKANGTLRTIRGNETIETAFKVVIYTDLSCVNGISPDGKVE